MDNSNLILENATLLFKNFSGEAGRFNPPGNRNFCVIIPDELAQKLIEDGWNIRTLPAMDDGTPLKYYTQVAVKYSPVNNALNPKIVLVTERGKTVLNEANVNILDWADIKKVDIMIRPYHWSARGATGVKGYVNKMYVTVEEDEFEKKYGDIPDIPDSAQNAHNEDKDVYPF